MKKIIYILFLLIPFVSKADATFLSDIPFSNSYADIDIIQETEENGISKNEYLTYLLSEENTLGRRIALVSALSIYLEFNAEESDDYFERYTKAFLAKVLAKYNATDINNAKISKQYKLLLCLMADYNTTSPNLKIYEKMAKEMPNSLAAQTILVFSQAYNIIYNTGRTFQNKTNLRNNYINPFKASMDNYTKDLRLQAVQSMLDWTEDIYKCWSLVDMDNLPCYCELTNEESLNNCFLFAADSLTKKIKELEKPEYADENFNEANYNLLKEKLLESIEKETAYINTLQTKEVNKSALKYFYIQQLFTIIGNYGNFFAMGSSVIGHNYSTPYTDQTGKAFFERSECSNLNYVDDPFSKEAPLYNTPCFKNYMKELNNDLNILYKELGGAKNKQLKECQLLWLKLREIHSKELNPSSWEGLENYVLKDILANRVALLYYYANPNKTSEIYQELLNNN